MAMLQKIRRLKIARLSPLLLALSISAIAGVTFPFIHGVFNFKVIIGAAIIACLITVVLSVFESLIYEKRLRAMSMKRAILIKSLVYATVISLCYVALSVYMRQSGMSEIKMLTFQSVFTFSLVASIIISSFVSISRILGQNELIRLLLGHYHKPREEDRILMFVDLAGSTAIAEKIGSIEYLNFLNSFFLDLTVAILDFGGEIHKYVGDEVIITWKMKSGLQDGSCVHCFFRMLEQVEGNRENYTKRYGMIPEFRAGLHSGRVVIGEMGDFKKEIAILGDTVNTTARMLSEASERNRSLLVSDVLVAQLTDKVKAEFLLENLGGVQLRGKLNQLVLYDLKLKPFEIKKTRWQRFRDRFRKHSPQAIGQ